jgi:hypothetical protein
MKNIIKSATLAVFSILLSFLLYIESCAQEWDLIPCVDEHRSIVSLRAELKPGVYGYCSGVIIEKTDEKHQEYDGFVLGKILTCDHLLMDLPNKPIYIKFSSGRQSKGKILKRDADADFMLISAWVDENSQIIPVAKTIPQNNDLCTLIGMGGVFNGSFTPPTPEHIRIFEGFRVGPQKQLFIDAKVISGDSGGPIISNGEIVGIISGGYKWFDYEENNVKKRYTWPTLSGSTERLINFLK